MNKVLIFFLNENIGDLCIRRDNLFFLFYFYFLDHYLVSRQKQNKIATKNNKVVVETKILNFTLFQFKP